MDTLGISDTGFITRKDRRTSRVIHAGKFSMDDRVRKIPKQGCSEWQGHVVGAYLTHEGIGYAVRSEREKNSVQIYPESQLEFVPEGE